MSGKIDKKALYDNINSKAEDVVRKTAEHYVQLIRYEISVLNTELAMASPNHGYDYKFLPDTLANSVSFHCNGLNAQIRIEPNELIKLNEQQKGLLDLCISNVKLKMNSRSN